MIVKVSIREVLGRKLGLVTEFNMIQAYTLEVEPENMFATFEEARQVWYEYDVMFEGTGDNKFTLVKSKTYGEELDDLEWAQEFN